MLKQLLNLIKNCFGKNESPLLQVDKKSEDKREFHLKVSPKAVVIFITFLTLLFGIVDYIVRNL